MIVETVRKARVAHLCSRCHKTIAPGEYYVDGRVPPNADTIGTGRWERLAWHVGAYAKQPCHD